jgi:hypothetical protein
LIGSLNEIVISSVDQIVSKEGGGGLTERRKNSGAGATVIDLIVINIAISTPISPVDKSKIQFRFKRVIALLINKESRSFFIMVK